MAWIFSETVRSQPRADKEFTRFRLEKEEEEEEEDDNIYQRIKLKVDNLRYETDGYIS